MKVSFILNKNAGSYHLFGDEIKKIVSKYETNPDNQVRFEEVEGKDLQKTVEDLVSKGTDRIVACGGDGTINTIASAIAGCDSALGVIPMGTFNHFAKDCLIPLGMDEAIKNIFEGGIQKVDIATVNEHVFVNNSSLGSYPLSVKIRDKRKLTGRSKIPAMISATIKVFSKFPLLKVKLVDKTESEQVVTPFIFIGNNLYELTGRNIGTRKIMNSGELCLFCVECRNRWELIFIILRSLFKSKNKAQTFKAFTGPGGRIETDRKLLLIALDGEIKKMKTPLEYGIKAGGLNVVLPKKS